MQQEIYPLVPVICEDEKFAEMYNEDMMSKLFQSQCMQVEEVEELVQQGVTFSQLIFINNEEQTLVNKFQYDGLWGDELSPPVVHLNLDESSKSAVGEVHRAIQNGIYNRGTG